MIKINLMNLFISIFMFGFIFYSYAGKSGGDLAIISANIFFGLFQLFVNSIICRIKRIKPFKIQIFIIACQFIEVIIFLNWGYKLNEFLKYNS